MSVANGTINLNSLFICVENVSSLWKLLMIASLSALRSKGSAVKLPGRGVASPATRRKTSAPICPIQWILWCNSFSHGCRCAWKVHVHFCRLLTLQSTVCYIKKPWWNKTFDVFSVSFMRKVESEKRLWGSHFGDRGCSHELKLLSSCS